MPVAASIHILVVDDQMSIRSLVRSGLNQLGVVHIAEAADGVDAMKSLMLSPVHLIISDFNMPNMDGLELLKAVRANPPTSKTAFIMLTGRADRELVQKAVQFGVNNYLVKPFSARELRARVDGAVRLARQRRQAARREQELRAEMVAERGRVALRQSQEQLEFALEAGRLGSW